MNDFFARQEDARRQSVRLIVLFALAVVGVALAVYLVAAFVYLWSFKQTAAVFWHPRLFLWTSGGTLLFVWIGSFWKIRELRAGGATVAMILGARPVPPQTGDPRERRLRNVVEEMAIASGVPVPDLYLLERERGINAFAAGHGLDDAVICVTRGAVELLDRDELQGVVAHEFSHILNGDMGLNLRLLGWLNGILLVSQAGEAVLRGMRSARGRGAGAIALAAAALYVVGYVGYFFGRLIKSAVSRQREYLGDASAVQFTRNPEGLAGALKKIGGLLTGSRLDHPRAAEVSHLFFSNGIEAAWLQALDSHPPLAERIRRLEPRFDGTFPAVTPLPTPPPAEIYLKPRPAKASPEPAAALTGAAVAALLERVGEPVREHIDLARRLINELPEAVVAATRDPFGACALVYGLLLDRDPAVRSRQEEILAARESGAIANEVRRLCPAVETLAPEVRLPLLDLSLPALRALSRDQFLRLKETVALLSSADSRLSLFEFTLRYLLLRHLEPRFTQRPQRPAQIYGLRGVQQECSSVLTALARVGHREETGAQQAFARGVQLLREPKAEFSFVPAGECGVASLERAFAVLDGASPLIKRRLLAACLECLIHDGTVTVAEIELFRAIADAIGCPVPPWLDAKLPQRI
ncbi:MAG: M48 family metallopeptidase [Geobacteraceae bacterium]|nr:M48 family metallopeptidase [Geobacteraceae bacterium]